MEPKSKPDEHPGVGEHEHELGLAVQTPGRLTAISKAAKRATTVRTAEPMAKPLPMAAVALPTASSSSVMARTSLPRPAISEMPPPLSAIGPYASTVMTMAVPASMPTAAIAMP